MTSDLPAFRTVRKCLFFIIHRGVLLTAAHMDSIILCSYTWQCALFWKYVIFHKTNKQTNKARQNTHKNRMCVSTSRWFLSVGGCLRALRCHVQHSPSPGQEALHRGLPFWTRGSPTPWLRDPGGTLTFPFMKGCETIYDVRSCVQRAEVMLGF